MVIQVDTREKGNKEILEYFNSIEQKFIKSKMYAGDYQRVDSVEILIDKKDSLMEIAGNLCRSSEHERIKREMEKAKEVGCKRFIFLIADERITNVEEVSTWVIPLRKNGIPFTKANPATLQKIMKTIEERYNVEFMFCKKKEMGEVIYNLLKK